MGELLYPSRDRDQNKHTPPPLSGGLRLFSLHCISQSSNLMNIFELYILHYLYI